jgi:hypothetical protein
MFILVSDVARKTAGSHNKSDKYHHWFWRRVHSLLAKDQG